jgi:TPR repeat protein
LSWGKAVDSKCLLTSFAALALAFVANADHARGADSNANPDFTHRAAFVDSHPDLHWRWQGVADYDRKRYGEAMTAFRRAARYADKPSQAMIAQMFWNGDGVKADRVMAYVWADLAAERGYPEFIATREKFWRELSADEQRAAIAAGQAVFDEYGDGVAKPREEGALRLARIGVTGSRTGHVGTLSVQQQVRYYEFNNTDGALYYAPKLWQPEQYWQWQDRVWTQPPEGKVEVGPIQNPPEH